MEETGAFVAATFISLEIMVICQPHSNGSTYLECKLHTVKDERLF